MNRRVCLSVWLLGMPLLTGALAGAQDLPTGPANLDFEQGTPGQVPPGWFVPPMVLTDGYGVKLTSDHPKSGKQCALVFRDPKATAAPKTFGNLMQRFAAGRYRGQRVRLRAAVRLEAPPGEGQTMLWLRVDRPKGQMGFFDNMADRPITASDWRSYEIVGDVADDAVAVNFGLILLGKGKAWIDDVSFTVMGKAVGTVQPDRLYTTAGLCPPLSSQRCGGGNRLEYLRHPRCARCGERTGRSRAGA